MTLTLVAHSLLRWLVLAGLTARPVLAALDWSAGRPYEGRARAFSGALVGMIDLQVILGFVLYSLSPLMVAARVDMALTMKTASLRFFVVEHPVMMVGAAVMAHLGSFVAKRQSDPKRAHLVIMCCFGLAELLVLLGIPWDRVF